jgi:SAM-dependent methyltransferase
MPAIAVAFGSFAVLWCEISTTREVIISDLQTHQSARKSCGVHGKFSRSVGLTALRDQVVWDTTHEQNTEAQLTQAGFIQDATYAGNFGNYRKLLNRVLNHDPAMFDLPISAKIGDIGCGYGDLLLGMKQTGYHNLIGVEPDPECRAGAVARGLSVSDGTLQQTGLANASLDTAIVNAVFHHIDDYENAVAEMYRIVRPGGMLCFLEPAPTMLRSAMDFLTFKTPLAKFVPQVQARYDVMILEMNTGLYPMFLNEQPRFQDALNQSFDKLWLRKTWFFQFGKYRRR